MTCAEAIRRSINPGEIVSFEEFVRRINALGTWTNETIWQSLMRYPVNIVPARYHWNATDQFLFLRGDGRYELYDPKKHPKIIER